MHHETSLSLSPVDNRYRCADVISLQLRLLGMSILSANNRKLFQNLEMQLSQNDH